MSQASPARRIRVGRILVTLFLLAAAAGGGYGASWINSRKFFLIVGSNEVRVTRGRMFPVGDEPFVPEDTALRPAYQTFALPGGLELPRGATTFWDRVELDQALFRVLRDCIEHALAKGHDANHGDSVARYLTQLRAIPGLSRQQQADLATLERDAAFVAARAHVASGIRSLSEARDLFRESARDGGGRFRGGQGVAEGLERVLEALEATVAASMEPSTHGLTPGSAQAATATATATH